MGHAHFCLFFCGSVREPVRLLAALKSVPRCLTLSLSLSLWLVQNAKKAQERAVIDQQQTLAQLIKWCKAHYGKEGEREGREKGRYMDGRKEGRLRPAL